MGLAPMGRPMRPRVVIMARNGAKIGLGCLRASLIGTALLGGTTVGIIRLHPSLAYRLDGMEAPSVSRANRAESSPTRHGAARNAGDRTDRPYSGDALLPEGDISNGRGEW